MTSIDTQSGHQSHRTLLRKVDFAPCVFEPYPWSEMAQQQLQSVAQSVLEVKGEQITYNAVQQIYAQHLDPVRQILSQHIKIWFSRKPGATARKLRQASVLVNGLMSSVVSLDNPAKMAVHLHAALRNKKYEDIVRCIYAFKGAGHTDLELVKEHRHQLQNHLLSFLEGLKNYYDTHLVTDAELVALRWGDFLVHSISQVEAVEVDDDLEDAVEQVPANPLAN